jgi:hypothetical protein
VRGQSLGSALLDAVLADVSGTISLTVWSWRMHARKLYESRGFTSFRLGTTVPAWCACSVLEVRLRSPESAAFRPPAEVTHSAAKRRQDSRTDLAGDPVHLSAPVLAGSEMRKVNR